MLHSPLPQLIMHLQEEVPSTNAWAWQFYDALQKRGETLTQSHLFIANAQSQGKGSQGRSWVSPAGAGLYVSMLSSFRGKATEQSQVELPCLTQKAAEIVVFSLKQTLPEAVSSQLFIKPINDIYCQRGKVGGLLLETRWRGSSGVLVTGVGLNLQKVERPLDARAQAPAWSLQALGFTPEHQNWQCWKLAFAQRMALNLLAACCT